MAAEAIVLSGKFNLISLLIMLRTRSRYSHASLLMSSETVIEASALANKVVEVEARKPHFGYWEKRIYIPGGFQRRLDIGEHARFHKGDKYDWRAGKGHILGNHKDDPRRFICFEFIGHVLKDYADFERRPEEMTARDLYAIAWK